MSRFIGKRVLAVVAMMFFQKNYDYQAVGFQIVNPARPATFTENRLDSPVAGSRKSTELKSFAVGSDTFLEEVTEFYQTAPYLAAFLTCGVKASAADYIAQQRSNDKASDATASNNNFSSKNGEVVLPSNLDLPRNVAFILYGGLYQGMTQEFIFNHIYPILFGTATDVTTVATKVVFDNLVIAPFLCLPISYLFKSVIYKDSPMKAMISYTDDVKEQGLLLKYWSVWCPVQCLTFSIVPEHFRKFLLSVYFH